MSERIICHILFPELKTSQHFAKLLSKSRSDAEFIPLDKFEDVNNVKIVLGDPRSLINCKNIPKTLEWVQSTWAGVDWFLPALIREYGKLEIPFKITRSAVYGKIIGEYILAQIINVERKLFKVHQNQLEGKWCRENGVLDFGTLDGRKLAVLGAGETATEFSRMLSVLDIETVANLVRTPRENSANHFTSIDTLLDTHSKKLDYLINTLPTTDKTRGILNRERISKLENCVFVNVGRGTAVSNEDIIYGLDNGHFSFAILDVFPVEPLPEASPLWKHPKVIISPHSSPGLSYEKATCNFFLRNLDKWVKNESMVAEVNLTRGY